jgi:UDP-N-acetylmuramyl pentapeptide phosphotransferase/UDP-N-acetylglucosamine-1-phosphate transferase
MNPTGAAAFAAFGSSVILVGLALWHSKRTGVIDVPNSRSSHQVATPRGGGVGLVLSTALVLAAQAYRLRLPYGPELVLVGIALGALSFIGWRDDRGLAPMKLRFAIQIAAAIALAALVNVVVPIEGWKNLLWLVAWAFWTLSAINVFNFMDGIDGMIATQGVIFGLYVSVLTQPTSLAGLGGLVLACSSLGFLVWNWAPAKIFMGDVGSAPLGFFIVIVGALATSERLTPILIFLPLAPLFFDATATLFYRWRRGAVLTTPHRSHLYQRMANDGWGHGVVTAFYGLAAILGGIIGLASRVTSATIIYSAIVIYLVIIVFMWTFLNRQFPIDSERSMRTVDRSIT